MKSLKKIVFVIALILMASFVSGIQSCHHTSWGGTKISYHEGWNRLLPFGLGILCLIWWYGIHTKKVFGWWTGTIIFFMVMIQLLIQGTWSLQVFDDLFTRLWGFFSQVAVAGLVFLAFRKWWIPKRMDYFVATAGRKAEKE